MHQKALDPNWDGLLATRNRPDGLPAMYQSWHDLLFLHAKCDPSLIQAMLPEGLTVETFDGFAWLGFVPFRMSHIRPRRLISMPWISAFEETNIRTYVTHPEHGPGVWFFSLDAARYFGCFLARQWFSLPYFHSSLFVLKKDETFAYSGARFRNQVLPGLPCQTFSLSDYTILGNRSGNWHEAEEESFEFWLAERYRLYSLGKDGRLRTALVHHKPYQLAAAELNVREINGLPSQFAGLEFDHALLAKSVNVECFDPTLI